MSMFSCRNSTRFGKVSDLILLSNVETCDLDSGKSTFSALASIYLVCPKSHIPPRGGYDLVCSAVFVKLGFPNLESPLLSCPLVAF